MLQQKSILISIAHFWVMVYISVSVRDWWVARSPQHYAKCSSSKMFEEPKDDKDISTSSIMSLQVSRWDSILMQIVKRVLFLPLLPLNTMRSPLRPHLATFPLFILKWMDLLQQRMRKWHISHRVIDIMALRITSLSLMVWCMGIPTVQLMAW